MNKHQTALSTSAAICLVALLLSGCGESDLLSLQEQELEAARLESGELAADPANPDVENGSQEDVSNPHMELSDYELVFADDFRDDSLDPSKWNTTLSWGPDLLIHDQLQYYVDSQTNPGFGYDPFSFDGEQLSILASETPESLRASANEQPWLSGVLTTAGKFDFQYGYVEARMQVPQGQGVWPAFWMLGSDYTDVKPELYVMEFDGSRAESIFLNYRYEDESGQINDTLRWEESFVAAATGFHQYGVAWSPGELLFYIDRQPRYRIIGERVASQDMYLILNLAMGGVWPGPVGQTTGSPVALVIDYVRAYQLKE
ncbi:glycoside hydrolase family 16 protein [Granulosicoccus antarcticus]|uniref:Endo-1,3-1,4-beta-glycanase ExsH n=1 Tax=Granulosicoccus antarcticus IMCC3135 TaxID=1192854 RepID=A0A2Z2NQV0_9GAMM|nr:glycoside hydrolase family 16 protein [Granulosicoccus antarcticus]ASJ72371.1 Endo-1,3-1,4-beta-glycanase ExsH [Granulosicoccus antarcticus IMCC3135]